ncbi:MAG: D-amino-acid transaminase [Pseudohongiellaceae bacterium]
MSRIVYLNGEYLPADAAKVSVFDRGFVFADGVYEVVPVVNGCLVDKQYFVERLGHSLEALSIAWPCSEADYFLVMEELIKRNELREGIVYSQVTRGVAEREFSFPKDCVPTFVAFTEARQLLDNVHIRQGIAVVTTDELRWKRRDIKSLNLLAQVLAKEFAASRGAGEVWMVEDGYVTEGGSSSAYIVKGGRIITRPLSVAILPGIRRRSLLELIAAAGIEHELRPFTVAEVLAADEAFISSATTVITPVVVLDDKPIGSGKPGEITRRVQEIYKKHLLDQT